MIMTKWIVATFFLSAVAFAPGLTTRSLQRTTIPPLHISWWDSEGDHESYQRAMQNNVRRTDFRNFLTQRSLQSFIYLLNSCRDPHTVRWLEEFGDWKNIEHFHGTGALNLTRFPTWDVMLLDMMKMPEDVVVVKTSKRGPGFGGRRTKNPFLEEEFVEFRIDVDPPSLVNRIISVREQLSAEWDEDLDTLRAANDMILESYHHRTKGHRAVEAKDASDSGTGAETLFKSSARDEVAFERNAQFMLQNSNAFNDLASSPLRQGNFDLLMLLSTQESVHRVLRNYKDAGREHDANFEWFRDFYVDRVACFFDGNQEHGRADDFLDELLRTAPLVKNVGNKVVFIDPLLIVEDIVRTRGAIAMEWKEVAANVQKDHTSLRRELLGKQMERWGHAPTATEETRLETNSFQ